MAQQPPLRSADGQWFWDGSQWQSLVSGDGQSVWSGRSWDPIPPGFTRSSAPPPPGTALQPVPPPPPAAPSPPAGEPRPSWLPADQPWPPPLQTVSPVGPPPPPPAPIDWAARREAAFGPMTSSGVRYAGFWIRFLAIFIDGLIVGIPLTILFFVLSGGAVNAALANPSNGSPQAFSSTPNNGLELVVQFLYFSYFWSSGSTPGMRIFGLRVVDASGQGSIGFGRAALRFLGYLVSASCCAIGLIWAAFDSRKRGWHDRIANTVVIYR